MIKKIPHTYVIVFSIIVISAVATWFVPGGTFQREIVTINGVEREVISGESFDHVESNPQTWEIFGALFKGFVNTANIIVFILMIGGAFWIMNDSKSLDMGILSFLSFTKKLEKTRFFKHLNVDNIVIGMIMLMFSLFGAVFGMSEETIAFIIIFVPLSISMGYDSIVGVSMCFVAAGLGFAGAILNPFTIGIAQGLSDLPLFSGIEYRMFCWIIINIVGISFVLRYMNKIRKNPESSPVYKEDNYWRAHHSSAEGFKMKKAGTAAWITYLLVLASLILYSFAFPETELSAGNRSIVLPVIPFLAVAFVLTGIVSLLKSTQCFILNLLMYTILFLVVGVMGYGWYVMEIAALFFAMGLASGMAMGYSPNKITHLFLSGTKDILSAAIIVGLAGGIIVILNEGNIIDTILYGISQSMADFGKVASVGIMYVIQNVLNILIPSGSGKAALTIPMMAQFSDLIGISRQATVMAFQFGDGFTNMIIPTSGVLIGVLEVAKIPYEKWFRWIAPLILILIILGFILLIPTVTMDLSGF